MAIVGGVAAALKRRILSGDSDAWTGLC